MGQFIITYTEEQKKAFEYYVKESMQEWTQAAFNNKCRQRIDAAILEKSDKNPKKIDDSEKNSLINGLDLQKRTK